MTAETTAAVTKALAAHRLVLSQFISDIGTCAAEGCDWRRSSFRNGEVEDAHRAHVAAVIALLVEAAAANARAEVVAAVEAVCVEPDDRQEWEHEDGRSIRHVDVVDVARLRAALAPHAAATQDAVQTCPTACMEENHPGAEHDEDRCACGHWPHQHDPEASPPLCMVCGDNTRCDYATPGEIAADRWEEGHAQGVIDYMNRYDDLEPNERLLRAVEMVGCWVDNPYRPEADRIAAEEQP